MEMDNVTTGQTPAFSQNSLITLATFSSFLRRRRRTALQLSAGIFSALLLLCLLFLPQSYTANISLAILQPTDITGGLLASATGLGASPTSKYVGVLKSRRFAEIVEARFHLQAFY